jgi:hypothetical protein
MIKEAKPGAPSWILRAVLGPFRHGTHQIKARWQMITDRSPAQFKGHTFSIEQRFLLAFRLLHDELLLSSSSSSHRDDDISIIGFLYQNKK